MSIENEEIAQLKARVHNLELALTVIGLSIIKGEKSVVIKVLDELVSKSDLDKAQMIDVKSIKD